ncbi:MAG: hypothetical protein AB1778_03070, partial [Candidatus Bipolaricaulota bacterium]
MRGRRTVIRFAGVATLAVLALASAAPGVLALDPNEYSIYPLGALVVDVNALRSAASDNGFVVLDVPERPQTASGQSLDVLGADRLLVTSGARFYLRVAHAGMTYALRPSAAGSELVVVVAAALEEMEALGSVLLEMQELGIVGMDVDLGGRQTFARHALKGPAVPAGVALDSALYGLVVSEDWFAYAAAKSIALHG